MRAQPHLIIPWEAEAESTSLTIVTGGEGPWLPGNGLLPTHDSTRGEAEHLLGGHGFMEDVKDVGTFIPVNNDTVPCLTQGWFMSTTLLT